MRVKARAVIWLDGKLLVARQMRRGRVELSLPGGRVNDRESVTDALVREVAEETGLTVRPGPLLYIAEFARSAEDHALEMIFLAEPHGTPGLNAVHAIDPLAGERPPVRPPIVEQIIRDAASDYRQTPRWLGDLGGLAPAQETRRVP